MPKKQPINVRQFNLVMMTARINESMPFHSLKMFSIDSDAQPLVSEQTSSSLEEVWLGHDDSERNMGLAAKLAY